MLDLLESFLDIVIDVMFCILVGATFILLFVTCPFWVVPYIIFRKRRENE